VVPVHARGKCLWTSYTKHAARKVVFGSVKIAGIVQTYETIERVRHLALGLRQSGDLSKGVSSEDADLGKIAVNMPHLTR